MLRCRGVCLKEEECSGLEPQLPFLLWLWLLLYPSTFFLYSNTPSGCCACDSCPHSTCSETSSGGDPAISCPGSPQRGPKAAVSVCCQGLWRNVGEALSLPLSKAHLLVPEYRCLDSLSKDVTLRDSISFPAQWCQVEVKFQLQIFPFLLFFVVVGGGEGAQGSFLADQALGTICGADRTCINFVLSLGPLITSSLVFFLQCTAHFAYRCFSWEPSPKIMYARNPPQEVAPWGSHLSFGLQLRQIIKGQGRVRGIE